MQLWQYQCCSHAVYSWFCKRRLAPQRLSSYIAINMCYLICMHACRHYLCLIFVVRRFSTKATSFKIYPLKNFPLHHILLDLRGWLPHVWNMSSSREQELSMYHCIVIFIVLLKKEELQQRSAESISYPVKKKPDSVIRRGRTESETGIHIILCYWWHKSCVHVGYVL